MLVDNDMESNKQRTNRKTIFPYAAQPSSCYYIVYDVWICFELFIVYKSYVETRNAPLEEIAKHFNGDAANLGGQAATEKSRQLTQEMHLEDAPSVETTIGEGKTNGVSHKDKSVV